MQPLQTAHRSGSSQEAVGERLDLFAATGHTGTGVSSGEPLPWGVMFQPRKKSTQ
jgi:hypothetical protein